MLFGQYFDLPSLGQLKESENSPESLIIENTYFSLKFSAFSFILLDLSL
ncbi:putative 13 kDa deflagellation-inducible protein [Schistosoma mansoni]|nr:putative 13 kDa deflagellation-inducible protein [Schistosoma mansoni]|eukprot:XP_018650593.1 putative 13 kDa deflagellation-inducible protein [Schistosoma mansoni]